MFAGRLSRSCRVASVAASDLLSPFIENDIPYRLKITFELGWLPDHSPGALKGADQFVSFDTFHVKQLIEGPKILDREVHAVA
jgi:hypothetical protein